MAQSSNDRTGLAALDAWRNRVAQGKVPTSARDYATGDLYRELHDAVLAGHPSPQELAVLLRSEEGIDRRGRALRILDRLGELQPAIDAVEAGQRQRGLR